jgi:predicted CoA-substrate-specific enzyme activase
VSRTLRQSFHDDILGLDVGSTTLKVVVLQGGVMAETRYVRHEGRLAEVCFRVLFDALPARAQVAVTGSGAAALVESLGVRAVHEVTAAVHAARESHPALGTLIDLGGQDAKLVVFEPGDDAAPRRPLVSMNDRCAAGTGVTLDRCLARLGLTHDELRAVRYRADAAHALSTRCGVFAETDLVNLARRGIPPDELVVSLVDAIVRANLAVLARGVTPRPPVLLLGGPHRFVPALVDAWRWHLAALWRDRGVTHAAPAQAVFVPENALHYAALGAARITSLREGTPRRRAAILRALEAPAATVNTRADAPFERGRDVPVERPAWPTREVSEQRHALGVDAGSTTTKAVVLDAGGRVVMSVARASGDPSADARAIVDAARDALGGAPIDVTVATGYGARWVGPLVGADIELVETVAHALSARAVAPDADVVCDIGGQDIKVLALDADGSVRDFRLSSQCGAGVGAAFEATARELGVARDDYAARAFAAARAPWFSERCVVFLDADRVAFQRQGYSPDELLAGLARALPRAVWNQVMSGLPPASLGRVFVLQGGVQHNAAAVRAQAEYLLAAVPGARVVVHPDAHLAGALGAALHGLASRPPATVARTHLPIATLHVDARARCTLCENRCPRAVLDLDDGRGGHSVRFVGHACDAGAEPDARAGALRRRAREAAAPDLYGLEARELFRADPAVAALRRPPRPMRVGIPRALAPLFRAYLQALGVASRDVVFSPPTSEALWREGAHHGSSDPCFPVKVLLAHVHHLVRHVHDRGARLDALFVPRVVRALTPVRHALDCASCPVVAASPALVRAAFERDGALTKRGISLLDPELTLSDPAALRAQLHDAFGELLGASRVESDDAVSLATEAARRFERRLQARGRAILDAAQAGRGGAVLVLARPYHVDPGVCHRVGVELQSLGYPVLGIRALPRDEHWLRKLLREDLARKAIADPFDVRDLLPEADNSGGAERLWAARVAARHGRLGVLDLSSFKCAQDAPTHGPVDDLFREARVVSCALHDLDETRPRSSLRVRLHTFAHAMRERGLTPWS